MKKVYLSLAMAALVVACSSPKSEESSQAAATDVPETTQPTTVKYQIDNQATAIVWRGEVAGVYGHDGLVSTKSGHIETSGDKITGGEFVVDMNSIMATDSASYSEEHPITDLEGHLKQGDFFLVEQFPEASFKIKSVEGNVITGDLTVRGKTHEETVEVSDLNINEKGLEANGSLTFDRQKYDVAWVHYMKDMVLSDDIQLKIHLVATR